MYGRYKKPDTGKTDAEKHYTQKADNTGIENIKTEKEKCLSCALMIIKSGNNSEKMLREKLFRRGYSEENITFALAKVKGAGFINDEKLLSRHAEYLAEKKYYGPYRIRIELYKKFGREITETYFDEAVEDIDFRSLAVKFAGKYAGKEKAYIAGKMKRNGYETAHIIFALNHHED